MSGLNSSTIYYYKVTTTDKAGNSTYKTGSSKTASACFNTDDNGNCITMTTYTSGDKIKVAGYEWYVMWDDGSKVALLMRSKLPKMSHIDNYSNMLGGIFQI